MAEESPTSSHVALVVVTTTPPDLKTENGQRSVINWLRAHNINFREIDAVLEAEVRNELCTLSGVRGNYPQVFITDQKEETTYVGGFEEVQSLVELNDLDPAMLANNPDLKTFKKVFEKCVDPSPRNSMKRKSIVA